MNVACAGVREQAMVAAMEVKKKEEQHVDPKVAFLFQRCSKLVIAHEQLQAKINKYKVLTIVCRARLLAFSNPSLSFPQMLTLSFSFLVDMLYRFN